MPTKYHIKLYESPNRYPVIGRSGIVDWGEGCLKCAECVKHECIYNAYRKRTFSSDIMGDTIDEWCKNCFRCVQGCPKRLIHKTINPEWEALGDDVYTPDIICITWEQAKSGKIPVSGAGYGGPYSGPGFDSMWTDMSEIVRPTRDGIHGREYISTTVEIGRKPSMLEFDDTGALVSQLGPSVKVPLPILFDILPFGDLSPNVLRSMATAASRLGTRMIVTEQNASELAEWGPHLIPLLEGEEWDSAWIAGLDMVEIPDSSDVMSRVETLKEMNPGLIVSVRVHALSTKLEHIMELATQGLDAIHCVADERGYEPGEAEGLHVKDIIRTVHGELLKASLRDEITFIASGGIAMAEHVIKAMLCGANLVAVDIPLLIALECRVCRNCVDEVACPVEISTVDSEWGARRIVNLMGAWHNQMLEMMGAMGIREARRLRGEQGRVMFFEDLESETFAKLFGGSHQ